MLGVLSVGTLAIITFHALSYANDAQKGLAINFGVG